MSDRHAARAYVGRFAPSPTGPLHFGSTVAALASWLDARAQGGRWLLRIEDLDPPREIPEAPEWIMTQLHDLGLAWDGEVLRQSSRLDAYQNAIDDLTGRGLAYPCTCSRKSTPPVYPGRCRDRTFIEVAEPYAIRLRTDNRVITTDDRIKGSQHWHLADDIGDFIIRRKDGLDAYQLAVVVDDAWQGITDVVRGDDLLDSTPRQIYLGDCLGAPALTYAHFPVVLGGDGHKLSKQAHASAVDTDDPVALLSAALAALGQRVPARQPRDRFLQEAVDDWDIGRVPHSPSFAPDTLQ